MKKNSKYFFYKKHGTPGSAKLNTPLLKRRHFSTSVLNFSTTSEVEAPLPTPAALTSHRNTLVTLPPPPPRTPYTLLIPAPRKSEHYK
jgi:hypothetical protein